MRISNHIFTDGSFRSRKNCWTSAVVVFRVGETSPFKIYIMKGTSNIASQNVTSELLAGIQAVKIAKKFGPSIVHHDYKYVNPSKQMWKKFKYPSKGQYLAPVCIEYLTFLESNEYRKYVIYKQIRSHSGELGNELADIACSLAYKLTVINQWIDLDPETVQSIENLYTNISR